MPRLFIISGCNGSGKTTASYSVLPELLDCGEFVNSDEFAKSLAPFNPEKASVAASRYMLLKIRYLFERKQDFCIETTLATRFLLKMIRNAQEAGYYVTIVYFWLSSPELAIARVKARVEAGGHNIKEETIRRRYSRGLYYLFRDFIPLCDHWILTDNSTDPATPIADGTKNSLHISDEEKYEKILRMNAEFEKILEGT
ncbi:MAG: zeta toxin family protein [Candidatus Cryptobacteroides sp.]|jgi:predicted ABC-type ATPase